MREDAGKQMDTCENDSNPIVAIKASKETCIQYFVWYILITLIVLYHVHLECKAPSPFLIPSHISYKLVYR